MPAEMVVGEGSPSVSQNFLVCPHLAFPLSVCVEKSLESLSLIRISILSDYGPTLMSSFNLNNFLKGPVSKYSHLRG